jgi:hypothetical protein
MERGESGQCAHSHHERCEGGACKCQCHTDPEAFEKRRSGQREAGQKAWATRQAASQETPPARTPKETTPKRPDVKSGAKAAIPAAAAKQIKSEFGVLLWGADQAAAMLAPQQWTTPEDRLTDDERTLLVNASYNELEARCPDLLRLLARAQASATEAVLLYAIAMIAAPRLARHKVIPESFASAIIFAPLVAQSVTREQSAAGVGAVPTSQPDRPNGNGQVHPGEPFAQGAPVRVGAPEQAGLGDLFNRSGDSDGPRNGRHPL